MNVNRYTTAAGPGFGTVDARLAGSTSVGSLPSPRAQPARAHSLGTIKTPSPHQLGFGCQGASSPSSAGALAHAFPAAAAWRSTSSPSAQFDARAQIEHHVQSLEQEEMEIRQTQARLSREQASTFHSDLIALRQEVMGIRATLGEHALAAKVDARLQEHATCIDQHMRVLQEADKRLDQVRTAQTAVQATAEDVRARIEALEDGLSRATVGLGDVNRVFTERLVDRDTKFSSLVEKVVVLEAVLLDAMGVRRDAWEKPQGSLREAARVTFPSVQARLHDVEATVGATTEKLAKAHSAVAERLTFLEMSMGESAEKHLVEFTRVMTSVERMGDRARQIENLLTAQGELGNSSARHESRINYLEKVLEEFRRTYDHEIEATKAVCSRLEVESGGRSEYFDATAERFEAIQKGHGTTEHRIVYLERIIGELAERNKKEASALKSAHGKATADIRQVADRHEALQARLSSVEQALE